MAQVVKNQPTVQKTRVWSLGWEDPLEKEMATHSSILAWRIPWIEKPGRLQSKGFQRVRHNWATNTFPSFQMPHLSLIAVKSVLTGWTPEHPKNSSQLYYIVKEVEK